MKPLHKKVINVHSNTLSRLVCQAKYRKYHLKFHNEGIIESSLLLKKTRIIGLIYAGHLGLTNCLHRAKQNLHWPGLYDQICELVTNCQMYFKLSKINNQKLPSKQLAHEVTLVIWNKIATDILHFENSSCYLW